MTRSSRVVSALAIALLLSACSTDGDTPLAPAGPALSGGQLTGGNRAEEDDTAGTTSTTDPADPDEDRSGGQATGGN